MKPTNCAFLGIALALSACGSSDSVPQGQVVATVDGKEITVAQLNSELTGLGAGPNATDAVKREALQRLIVRKLLVAEAKRRELDKKPAAAITLEQAEELAMVQLLGASFAEKVPKVSNEEADEFIRNNPANISRRRLLFVDQLNVPAANDEFFKQLAPIHRLDEAEALLKKLNLPYRRSAAVVDTQGLDPRMASTIVGLGQSEIWFNRVGNAAQVSGIVTTREVPLSGEAATQAATNFLTQQRATALIQGQMAGIIKGAKGRVMVNPAYGGKAPLPGQ